MSPQNHAALTDAELADIEARLRVQRPLHWALALRLLDEVRRLSAAARVASKVAAAAAPGGDAPPPIAAPDVG